MSAQTNDNPRWDGKLDQMISDAASRLEEMLEARMQELDGDSEIEQMLAAAFCIGEFPEFISEEQFRVCGKPQTIEKVTINELRRNYSFSEDRIDVFQQIHVLDYRVDFLCASKIKLPGLDISPIQFLAIECDGHEFHEKTKEQVARDKLRDRRMLVDGIPVMRFAGSEIWANPTECAGQVGSFFFERRARLHRIETELNKATTQ